VGEAIEHQSGGVRRDDEIADREEGKAGCLIERLEESPNARRE
jgi:hypothetical protein